MTAEGCTIGVEDDFIFTSLWNGDVVVGVGLGRVEVYHTNKIRTFEGDDVVAIVTTELLSLRSGEDIVIAERVDEALIKVVEEFVFEIRAIYERPLATAVVVGPIVTFAWEV